MIAAMLIFIVLILVLESNKQTSRWNAEQDKKLHDPLRGIEDSDAFLIRKGLR